MIVVRALLGALVVVLMSLLANTKNYVIVGLVPLFPTFALIGNYIVGSQRGTVALKATLLFGMFSLIPYFLYLLTAYFAIERTTLTITLAIATSAWLVSALVLVLIWNRMTI